MQLYHSINRPWDLSPEQAPILRIGGRRLAVADIREFSKSAHQEPDFLPSLFGYVVSLVFATLFLVLVMQAGWRERFLMATAVFALIGLSNLVDVGRSRRLRLYRLTIVCQDGRREQFTTCDPDEVDRLAAALRSAALPEVSSGQ